MSSTPAPAPRDDVPVPVPLNFRSRVSGLQAASASTRTRFYDAVSQVAVPDDARKLPTHHAVLDKVDMSENTFRNHFDRGRYPVLGTGDVSGMPRLVREAKMWTFEPYAQGWREQSRRLQLAALHR